MKLIFDDHIKVTNLLIFSIIMINTIKSNIVIPHYHRIRGKVVGQFAIEPSLAILRMVRKQSLVEHPLLDR